MIYYYLDRCVDWLSDSRVCKYIYFWVEYQSSDMGKNRLIKVLIYCSNMVCGDSVGHFFPVANDIYAFQIYRIVFVKYLIGFACRP